MIRSSTKFDNEFYVFIYLFIYFTIRVLNARNKFVFWISVINKETIRQCKLRFRVIHFYI